MGDTREALYVGIDLGTSRSSVSASNGERHVIDSYVGWPVDSVARKVVKKRVMIGREALENRPMLDLHRPLEAGHIKEGSEKDEEAVRELLRHLLSLAGVESVGNNRLNVRAVVGVPARALVGKQQRLRHALKGIADSLIIVPEPFAVAYGLDALLHTMIIDMGAGTTDFCVMSGHYPAESELRSVTVAGDVIDEQLAKLIRERFPEVRLSIHMVRAWKEHWSFVGEPKKRVVVTVPVDGTPTQLDITNEMRSACEVLLLPVAETMIELLLQVEPEYQEKVRHHIILAGGGSLIAGLGENLEQVLSKVGGGQVQVVKDPIFAGSDGGLAIALDAADSDWEMLATEPLPHDGASLVPAEPRRSKRSR
ncbi:MAG TPA: rod shape-determining protein [Candidatus Tectomicrobia bacterium]|nr:rod shape-determining protein [Candidatus Tectomicrobia bacterium]